MVEYFTTDDVTLLFGVRTDWEEPKVVEIERPLAEIRQYVADNFSLEADERREGLPSSSSRVRDLDLEQWQEKFAPFVEPIRDWAEPGDYLYLVPHDVLHYLPLHTLKIDGQHLIERHPVLYTPSASVLKYCQAKRKEESILKNPDSRGAESGTRALVLGDSHGDLVHARTEAIAVANAFGTQAHLRDAANELVVRRTLERERESIDVLHFACHAYFDQFQPLKSGLLMAPAENGEDEETLVERTPDGLPRNWFLTAEDFFGIEMKADLVTLSACDTGASQVRPGDELFGLMRSLIYAGTPSVVMSLWSVDQMSSSILMQKLYEALRAGETKVVALQLAQLAVKELTAAEAIAYCESAIDLLGEIEQEAVRTVEADIAQLHFQAGNYQESVDLYQRLLSAPGLANDKRRSRELTVGLSQSEFMSNYASNRQPDYEKKVYSHPFFWAPFVLVGDWK